MVRRPVHTRRLTLLFLALLGCALFVPQTAGAVIKKTGWVKDVTLTEYYPTPEKWFVGAKVNAPGLTDKHRADWLYSAYGLPMEGSGIGLDGRMYHFASGFGVSWVGKNGKNDGTYYWLDVGWRNKKGAVTFPLEGGGWSNGPEVKKRYESPKKKGVSFELGGSTGASGLKLKFWRSIAVDPDLIKFGSRVYVPAYRNKPGGGWFTAADTGGAIDGRHIDIYRSPPKKKSIGGNYYPSKRICVVPPKKNPGICAEAAGGTGGGSTGGGGGVGA
jgi:3D (Asp-Asp-Asp) domain-containing protein